MTLHLSKYSAKLAKAAFYKDKETFKKTAIDTLIIVFSSSNIFNSLLTKMVVDTSISDESELSTFAQNLYAQKDFGSYDPLMITAMEILEQTGKMCKAVESLDHLEALSFREDLLASLSSLFQSILIACQLTAVSDIEQQIEERLLSVEQKNPYFAHLGNYRTGYL